MSVKDMYADLEKIEARGKRKKEKSKGLFSSFGKKEEPKPAAEPPEIAQPKPVQAATPPEPVAEKPVRHPPAPEPKASDWQPPTGGKLKKAQDELVAYKKWLNNGYKSGVLTKQHCIDMVRKKEVELGLRPPE